MKARYPQHTSDIFVFPIQASKVRRHNLLSIVHFNLFKQTINSASQKTMEIVRHEKMSIFVYLIDCYEFGRVHKCIKAPRDFMEPRNEEFMIYT